MMAMGKTKAQYFFGARYFRTNISPYLLKGKLVAITGDLKKNEYEGKTYLSINATEVKLLGGKSNDTKRLAEGQTIQSNNEAKDFDDEIPF